MKTKILFLLSFLLIGGLLFANNVLAQEEEGAVDDSIGVETTDGSADDLVTSSDTDAIEEESEEVLADEDITAEDLGVSDPRLLPDNPFYFVKDFWRNVKTTLTVNPVKKAELRLRYANQRLIEAKKVAQKTGKEEIVQKTMEKYQNEVEKIKTRVENFKEKAQDNPKIDQFLDKLTDGTIKQQQLMDRLEKNLSDKPEVLERIQVAKEKSLENFGTAMERLENKERVQERLETNLEKIEGSQYKNFKNLEVLIRLEDKVPEQAKEAIQQAQENSLKRLNDKLEQMSPQDQEKFGTYLDNISGDQTTHLRILQRLEEAQPSQALKQTLEQNRERAEERVGDLQKNILEVQERIREQAQERAEQQTETGAGGPEEETSARPSERPTEQVACPMVWSPVCGKDGKTYGNPCLAKVAGVEVAYRGKCGERNEKPTTNDDTIAPQKATNVNLRPANTK